MNGVLLIVTEEFKKQMLLIYNFFFVSFSASIVWCAIVLTAAQKFMGLSQEIDCKEIEFDDEPIHNDELDEEELGNVDVK